MREGLFNDTILYTMLFLSVFLSTLLLIKHKTEFLKHLIVPALMIVLVIMLILSIFVGGEIYKYVSDCFAILWFFSTLIAAFSLRRTYQDRVRGGS